HLKASTTTELEPGGNKLYVYILAGIALFMVVMAFVNFVNLSPGIAARRSKEVVMRKVVRLAILQLVKYILSASILLTCVSLLIAFVWIQLALPIFNNIAAKELSFDAKPIFAFIGLGMLVGIVAGIYPAFYLSSFKPIAVLKGRPTTRFKNFNLRSRLVVF